MAKKVTVQLVDDLDGSVIADRSGETIEFAVNGVDYVIDLKPHNALEFHKRIGYYIEHATRTGGRKRKTGSMPASTSAVTRPDAEQTRVIRQWAFDNGYEVRERGRIPASIKEAFEAAH